MALALHRSKWRNPGVFAEPQQPQHGPLCPGPNKRRRRRYMHDPNVALDLCARRIELPLGTAFLQTIRRLALPSTMGAGMDFAMLPHLALPRPPLFGQSASGALRES